MTLLGVPGFRFTMFACRQKEAILFWGYLRNALNILFSCRPWSYECLIPHLESIRRSRCPTYWPPPGTKLRTGDLRLRYKLYVNSVAVQLFSEDSTDFLYHSYHFCGRRGVGLITPPSLSTPSASCRLFDL